MVDLAVLLLVGVLGQVLLVAARPRRSLARVEHFIRGLRVGPRKRFLHSLAAHLHDANLLLVQGIRR